MTLNIGKLNIILQVMKEKLMGFTFSPCEQKNSKEIRNSGMIIVLEYQDEIITTVQEWNVKSIKQ